MSTEYCTYPDDWPDISRRIRERDSWRCRWCDSPVNLGVAHLNHLKDDNRDENLLTLCWSCHSRYDARTSANHPAKKAKRLQTRRRKRREQADRYVEQRQLEQRLRRWEANLRKREADLQEREDALRRERRALHEEQVRSTPKLQTVALGRTSLDLLRQGIRRENGQ